MNEQLETKSMRNDSIHLASGDISIKSRLIATLLCFFFGAFGVHRFYVGKISPRILQLLLGWATLCIWNLVDLIMLLGGTFRDGENKRIKNWSAVD